MKLHPLVTHLRHHPTLATMPRVVVAVSGGPDSLALLYGLCEFYPATAVMVYHLDHRLRGAQSAADAQFVADAAQSLGVAGSPRLCQSQRSSTSGTLPPARPLCAPV
ncbi:MAG: hypothetical protein EBS29_04060 [Chloroflexia bacterium]|nr:hypothetical protein [Chloroflexia bacterium]